MIATLLILAVWGVFVWLYVILMQDFLAYQGDGIERLLGWVTMLTFAGLILFSGIYLLTKSIVAW